MYNQSQCYEDTKILLSVKAPINFLTLDYRPFSVYVDIWIFPDFSVFQEIWTTLISQKMKFKINWFFWATKTSQNTDSQNSKKVDFYLYGFLSFHLTFSEIIIIFAVIAISYKFPF